MYRQVDYYPAGRLKLRFQTASFLLKHIIKRKSAIACFDKF